MHDEKEVINVSNLNFSYDQSFSLSGISIHALQGEIFGLLGPSGSGKTTLINILTKELKFYKGKVSLFNENIEKCQYSDLGILTDSTTLYENLSIIDNLNFFCSLKNVSSKEAISLLKEVELYDHRDKKVKDCSKGMKQRALLASILVNEPKLLILDEPTDGLDPVMKKIIHTLLLRLKSRGMTILVSTHDMNEAEYLCDRVSFIHNGEILETGLIDELKYKYNKNRGKILFKCFSQNKKSQFIVNSFNEFKKLDTSTLTIESIHSMELTMNDLFLKLISEGDMNESF